jgi:hypothetical protein
MATSTINRFIDLFTDSFEELGVEIPMAEIERLAALVHHSMDHGQRRYHRSAHIFELCRGTNARQTLAALFHDVVYCQLDNGLPHRVERLLNPALHPSEEPWLLILPATGVSESADLCMAMFGVEPGHRLELGQGLNEFLSAVVAVEALGPWLAEIDMVAVVACIEGTIPFRLPCADGSGPFDAIARRLPDAAATRSIALDSPAISEITTAAVDLANRDVAAFGSEDTGRFLAGTWLLIEESNANLSAVGVYTLKDYRVALAGMDKFLRGLDPDHVFHRFENVPNDAEFNALRTVAARNITFACDYLGVKILAIAMLEAVAEVTGGDCTVSMMLGNIHSPDGTPERVENYLPEVVPGEPIDPELLQVLEGGRAWESGADLTTSPVSSFVYRRLGSARCRELLEDSHRYFDGELDALGFLTRLGNSLIRTLVRACARIATSRHAALMDLERRLAL